MSAAFELLEPESLSEAVHLLDRGDPTVRPVAGATALMLMMKAGVFRPSKLVSLRKIERRYGEIAPVHGGLRIGALATLNDLERSREVQAQLPLVSQALVTLANVRVRNVATVGGALAHGDPHMDLPPVLMALGAQMMVIGPHESRSLAVEDLFVGYYETGLAADELIAELFVPAQGKAGGAYAKVTTGSADDWPALGIAAVVEAQDGVIRALRLVASAATNKATRLTEAERILIGQIPTDDVLDRAAEAAVESCEFIPDIRGSVPYKRDLMRVYVRRVVRRALTKVLA